MKAGWCAWALCATVTLASTQVVVEHNDETRDFRFKTVPRPARNDAATEATFTMVEGRKDSNSGDLDRLHDGKLPTTADMLNANFFFAPGSTGGTVQVDLGRAIDIRDINTYSWHLNDRAPQVYTLFAGEPNDWKQIARVDTRSQSGEPGGQYGVSVTDSTGRIGRYRYLLFAISRTETNDPFGNTFFSEIDVIDGNDPTPEPIPTPNTRVEIVDTVDGKYRLIVDITETPDLAEWVHAELAPVLQAWYPKIIKLLEGDQADAPKVQIVFSADMTGVAATSGTQVQCAAKWFRQNLKGEAKGALIHELVHVVQRYKHGYQRAPGWLTKGIADYVRWFLYEPQSHGAEIAERQRAAARYDASYRVSAHFLNWLVTTHNPRFLPQLSSALHDGPYNEELWMKLTQHTVQELGEQWKASLQP